MSPTLWWFMASGGPQEWMVLPTSTLVAARSPTSRHVAVYHPDASRDTMLVFGGWSYNGFFDTTSEFSFRLNLWLEDQQAQVVPAPRSRHRSVQLGNTFLVFGGITVMGLVNDTWALSPVASAYHGTQLAWSQLLPNGPAPSARYGHAMAAINGSHALVVGGHQDIFGSYAFLNDVWAAHMVTPTSSSSQPTVTWTLLQANASRSDAPVPRAFHACVVFERNAYVYGGFSFSGTGLPDFWRFSLDTLAWYQVQLASAPPGRFAHTANVLFTPNDRQALMVIYGGARTTASFSLIGVGAIDLTHIPDSFVNELEETTNKE